MITLKYDDHEQYDQDDVLARGPPSTPGWLLKLTRGARHTYDHNHTTHTFTKENGSAMIVTMTMTMVMVMMTMGMIYI